MIPLLKPDDPKWIHCPTCAADRERANLERGRVCGLCGTDLIAIETPALREKARLNPKVTDEDVELAAAAVAQNARPKAKPKRQRTSPAPTQASPPEPTPAQPPVAPQTTSRERNAEVQAQADEAFALPYVPPQATVEQEIERELAYRVLCRRRLMPFIKRFRPKYLPGWVHEDICRRLERFVEQVERGEEPRLLLMMPPRAGKSEIGSRNFPPWVLGKHPEWEIIAASHTSSLTMSFSRYIRDLIRDPAYTAVFPATRLDPSSQSVENWNLTGGGGYLAAGVGTGITGRGAHILLLDDLVKDIEAADSDTIRDNTWEWYASTAYTRLAPGGGVIGIMCMTGDTPVMLADGTTTRLDTLRPGTEIATYARGILAQSRVAAVKSSGRDSVFKITMRSGKIVRANQRHPFLTVAPSGELAWTRLKNLTTALRIVTVKGSGANGEGLSALPRGATSLPSVAGFARITTEKRNGLTEGGRSVTSQKLAGTPASSIVTASPLPSTTPCMTPRTDAVLFAGSTLTRETHPGTGRTSSPSTTATTPARSEACSVTTVAQVSDTLVMSQWHLPPLGTSDFTLDSIVSIEPDGEEEVFDVQVDDTENFIANGLVSHNTWWHDDDWAGRIQQVMSTGEGDKFEIIRYPAINDQGDEYILTRAPGEPIEQILPGHPVPEGARLTRPMNTAIHPARYSTEAMMRIKRNLFAAGQQRVWNALYQQNPLPDDGILFTKEMFRYYGQLPDPARCHIYQAWDFAISEGKENDWTVGTTLYQDERDNLYVADVRAFKSGDSFVIVDEILDYAREWNATLLGFEDGQIWKAMEAVFERRCAERKQYPSFEILKPLTDKMVRASPLRGRMQLGKVFFPTDAPWQRDLYLELTRFPNVKHDDRVDSLAWAVRLTLSRSAPRHQDAPARGPKQKSWKSRLPGVAGGPGASHMSA